MSIKMQIPVKHFNSKVVEDLMMRALKFEKAPKYICYIIGDDEASHRYVSLKHQTSKQIGVDCTIKHMSKVEFALEMLSLCNKTEYTPIRAMLQLPTDKASKEFFDTLVSEGYIIDVDHLGGDVLTDMWSGNFDRVPGTPKGVLALLNEELSSLEGKKVAVVGSRSKTVGSFLVPLLQNENATVSLYHSRSAIADKEFENYDVVISCVGSPRMIKQKHLGSGKKVLIDIGVSMIEGKAVGDFDEDVRDKNRFTPYVGAVGLLTRTFLVSNVIESYETV
ncbi:MAG: hypothetical protein ACRC6E_05550 [Fusobacteriaceae bacterium]